MALSDSILLDLKWWKDYLWKDCLQQWKGDVLLSFVCLFQRLLLALFAELGSVQWRCQRNMGNTSCHQNRYLCHREGA
jgi:hypothetical protein